MHTYHPRTSGKENEWVPVGQGTHLVGASVCIDEYTYTYVYIYIYIYICIYIYVYIYI